LSELRREASRVQVIATHQSVSDAAAQGQEAHVLAYREWKRRDPAWSPPECKCLVVIATPAPVFGAQPGRGV
jgi:hypothetical protein